MKKIMLVIGLLLICSVGWTKPAHQAVKKEKNIYAMHMNRDMHCVIDSFSLVDSYEYRFVDTMSTQAIGGSIPLKCTIYYPTDAHSEYAYFACGNDKVKISFELLCDGKQEFNINFSYFFKCSATPPKFRWCDR